MRETDNHSVGSAGLDCPVLCCARACDSGIIRSYGRILFPLTGFDTTTPVVDVAAVKEEDRV